LDRISNGNARRLRSLPIDGRAVTPRFAFADDWLSQDSYSSSWKSALSGVSSP
jgi:hypothetical protein